jgi:hypothetical protein
LVKRLLPALLAAALLVGLAPEQSGKSVLFGGPIATVGPADADHDHEKDCAQDTAGLHCPASGCAQPAELDEQTCPAAPVLHQPTLTRDRRLGSLPSQPVLQPPVLAASA